MSKYKVLSKCERGVIKNAVFIINITMILHLTHTTNLRNNISLGIHPPPNTYIIHSIDCNNYRGITLLSCLGKLFASTLNERLYIFCENNHILKEIQAGFRKGYSTMDHIFVLKHIIDLFI